jgi:toxin ParE1/3/4
MDEVLAYIAQENPQAAIETIDALEEKAQLLTDNPQLGRARPDLLENIRSFPYGNYIIFYRPTSDGILIVRVLHSARDVSDRMF